jgi:hypothetical protein
MLRWYGAIFKRGFGKRVDCDCPSIACRLESREPVIITIYLFINYSVEARVAGVIFLRFLVKNSFLHVADLSPLPLSVSKQVEGIDLSNARSA